MLIFSLNRKLVFKKPMSNNYNIYIYINLLKINCSLVVRGEAHVFIPLDPLLVPWFRIELNVTIIHENINICIILNNLTT